METRKKSKEQGTAPRMKVTARKENVNRGRSPGEIVKVTKNLLKNLHSVSRSEMRPPKQPCRKHMINSIFSISLKLTSMIMT